MSNFGGHSKCQALTYFLSVNIVSSGEFDHCLKGLWVLKSHEAETAAPAGIVVIHDPDVFDLTEASNKSDRCELNTASNQ